MLRFAVVLIFFSGAVLGGSRTPVDYELSHLQASRSYDYGSDVGGKSRSVEEDPSGSDIKAAGTALYGYGGGGGYGGAVGYGVGHAHAAYETPVNDYQVGYGAGYYRKPGVHAHHAHAISPGIVLGQSLGVVHGNTVGYKGLNSKGWVPIARPAVAVTKTAVYHESPIEPIVNNVLKHTAAKLGHAGYALAGGYDHADVPVHGAVGYGYAGAGVPIDGHGHGLGHGHGHGLAVGHAVGVAPVPGYAQVALGGYGAHAHGGYGGHGGYPVAAVAPLVHKKPAEISITPSISYGYSYKLVPESLLLHPTRLSGPVGIPLKGAAYGAYAPNLGYGRGYGLGHGHAHSHY